LDGAENKFEEAAIEAYNESLLSIQNFNTKLNFYRFIILSFFHTLILSFKNHFNSNGRMHRERVKENYVIPVSP